MDFAIHVGGSLPGASCWERFCVDGHAAHERAALGSQLPVQEEELYIFLMEFCYFGFLIDHVIEKINKETGNCVILHWFLVGFVIPWSLKKTQLVAWTPAVDISPCFLALYYLSWPRHISAITIVVQAALGPLKLTLWNISGEMLQVQWAGRDPAASLHQPRILKSFCTLPYVIKLLQLEGEKSPIFFHLSSINTPPVKVMHHC